MNTVSEVTMKNRKKYYKMLLYEKKHVIRLMIGRINADYTY